MKYLGLMHYNLGLEVWQRHGEVFIGQAKYVVNTLQNFGMMDCKSITTPLVTYIIKLRDFDSDLVDSFLYR
jgi:hypothetical protein